MEDIAIKVPKLSNFSTDSVRDFYDEAKTALQFDHENVLRCWGISMGKNHIIYRYIDPSCHNLENCLPPRFVSQRRLGRPLAALPAKGVLRDKLWKEKTFKMSAQRFSKKLTDMCYKVEICNNF